MVFDKHFLGYDRRKLGLQNDYFAELVIVKLLGCFFKSSFANSLEINFLHKYSLLSIPSIAQERTGSKTESEVEAMNDLKEIKEKLAAIESLLQRLPEIQAAVFLLMRDEYETAKAQGRDARQLWSVPNPDQR